MMIDLVSEIWSVTLRASIRGRCTEILGPLGSGAGRANEGCRRSELFMHSYLSRQLVVMRDYGGTSIRESSLKFDNTNKCFRGTKILVFSHTNCKITQEFALYSLNFNYKCYTSMYISQVPGTLNLGYERLVSVERCYRKSSCFFEF